MSIENSKLVKHTTDQFERIERKMNVKEFCHRYDMLKTKEQKDNFVKDIVFRTYCPVLEKKIVLQTLLEKTVVTGKNGVMFVDGFLGKVNIVTAIIILYTKINVKKEDNDTDTAFDDYDELYTHDMINKICAVIGERELNELLSVNETLISNFMEEHKTVEAYISRCINEVGAIIDSFGTEGLNELLEVVKNNMNTEK